MSTEGESMTEYANMRYKIISRANMQMAASGRNRVNVSDLADELGYNASVVREILKGVKPEIKMEDEEDGTVSL